ncbi:MAG: hypothetical protein K0Q61_3314, partial [Rhodococcus erythropolis]|nr:hypothetical protein [Rhodococcus erythropolis]
MTNRETTPSTLPRSNEVIAARVKAMEAILVEKGLIST